MCCTGFVIYLKKTYLYFYRNPDFTSGFLCCSGKRSAYLLDENPVGYFEKLVGIGMGILMELVNLKLAL